MEPSILQEKKEFIVQSLRHLRLIDVAVLLTSLITLYLFRLQDGYQLDPIWQLKQPPFNADNLYAKPLITDLDGNGLKELVVASRDKIEVFIHHSNDFDDDGHGEKDETTRGILYHLHLKNELTFEEILDAGQLTVYPIALSAGCTTLHTGELCPQSLAIVWSDWSVTLLSDQLKLLWRSKPFKLPLSEKLKITEMSVLVVQSNRSDPADRGLVVVGGVLHLKEHQVVDTHRQGEAIPILPTGMSEEISKERAGVEPNITHYTLSLDPELAKFIGHYNTYALDGETGTIKWKHEPGDFELPQPDVDEHLHFKLRLRKKRLHQGEVHWKTFGRSFLKHLPYTWKDPGDTDIALGLFETSFSSPSTPTETVVSEQLKGIFKGKAPKETVETERSNAVVFRHRKAIEVLNLENGSPLCVLPLETDGRVNLGDVNGDGSIDNVRTYIYYDSDLSSADNSPYSPSCFVVATDASTSSTVHFNSSICKIASFFGSVSDVEVPSPRVAKLTSLAPLLVETRPRSSGVSHHVLGYGLSQPQSGMDAVVLLNSGQLSAFGPSGRLLWQVDTGIIWAAENENSNRIVTMKPVSLNPEGRKDAVVVLGSNQIVAVSLLDGAILSTHSLPCHAMQPLVSGDIDNNIDEEFLIRCNDRYLGFSLKRYNRLGLTILLYSGIACLVAFLLAFIKFVEREDSALDTIEAVLSNMRLLPSPGPRF